MTVRIDIDRQQYARINRILNKIPQQMQFAAYDKALKPAAQVVQKRAEELAPNGEANRARMSATSAKTWSTTKINKKTGQEESTQIPLAKLIQTKTIKGKGKSDPYALVGPKYPDGNKANFIHPMKAQVRQRKYWGRESNRAPSVTPKDNDFLKRAADETRSEQLRAFTRALIPAVRKAMQELARGN